MYPHFLYMLLTQWISNLRTENKVDIYDIRKYSINFLYLSKEIFMSLDSSPTLFIFLIYILKHNKSFNSIKTKFYTKQEGEWERFPFHLPKYL